ncbi:MAG: Gfo/Idh/MocA family oxidoreductase [Planctomycetota bacterium]
MAKRRTPVGIGLVGLGFMGLTHLRASRGLKGGRVVAISTSDPRKAKGDFSRVKGNFGDAGAREDMTGIEVHSGLDELLANPDVELVDLCLPSHLHAKAATRCLNAGKSVLVEKPIAVNPKDAQAMLAAAKKSKTLLMVAQVLKFFPEHRALDQAIRREKYGKLLSLHLRRVIARPKWSDDDWLGNPKLSGGMAIDLHIHDTDYAISLFGRPRAVTSTGLMSSGQVDSIRTTYDFGKKGPLVTAEAGWINGASLPFEHGYEACFEDASVYYNSTHCPTPKVFGKKSERPLPLGKAKDAFTLELQAAVDSVRSGEVDPFVSAKSAALSLDVCLAEIQSLKKGTRIPLR